MGKQSKARPFPRQSPRSSPSCRGPNPGARASTMQVTLVKTSWPTRYSPAPGSSSSWSSSPLPNAGSPPAPRPRPRPPTERSRPQPPLAHRDGVRGHRPHRRPGPPHPPGRLRARPLGHPGVAPPPRCHLCRGRLPGPHGHHPTGHGEPAHLAIGILQRHGWRNSAAALRHNARDATRVLPLLGITSP